ncbi:MAG: RtcB family protein [Azoarcus sp.]|nr:RtcB family protein [Azoarcus sp.]
MDHDILVPENAAPIKMWTQGVPVEDDARRQLIATAKMPFIFSHLAVMPDVHLGKGSTIGSVIPTRGAIIPAAVGVDIGCGMMAMRTTLSVVDLPDDLSSLRAAIERHVPHGRDVRGGVGRDPGAWGEPPRMVEAAWESLRPGFEHIVSKYPRLEKTNNRLHLGTLGTGNHFIEVSLDEADRVWFMLHSGSRGVGNAIGTLFIQLAQQDMANRIDELPSRDLAYFEEGSARFDDYMEAVAWAQTFARKNRDVMMANLVAAVRAELGIEFEAGVEAVDCHHNYVQREAHFGEEVWVTRKGAVSAKKGEVGIIPGSMGAKSHIVLGLGNEEAFCSCSHGAGRAMSRSAAKRCFTVGDQIRATAHVECRKDAAVIDEIPMAYKDLDAVMRAQRSLVEVSHTLRQVVCVKG